MSVSIAELADDVAALIADLARSRRVEIIVDRGNCRLYEFWDLSRGTAGWHAGSVASWNFCSFRTANFKSLSSMML